MNKHTLPIAEASAPVSKRSKSSLIARASGWLLPSHKKDATVSPIVLDAMALDTPAIASQSTAPSAQVEAGASCQLPAAVPSALVPNHARPITSQTAEEAAPLPSAPAAHAIAHTHVAGATSQPPSTSQLPTPPLYVSSLTGRESDGRQILGFFLSGGGSARVACVSGPAGVGKSWLARAVATEHDRLLGGTGAVLLVLEASGGLTVEQLEGRLRSVLPDLMAMLDGGDSGVAAAAAGVLDASEREARRLLVVDNAECLLEADGSLQQACADLLEKASRQVDLLITSRQPLRNDALRDIRAKTFELGGLSAAAAAALVRSSSSGSRLTESDVAKVAQICGGVPRQMLLMLQSLAGDGGPTIEGIERVTKNPLLRTARLLPARLQQALTRLSVFATGFDADRAMQVVQVTKAEIQELYDLGLLQNRRRGAGGSWLLERNASHAVMFLVPAGCSRFAAQVLPMIRRSAVVAHARHTFLSLAACCRACAAWSSDVAASTATLAHSARPLRDEVAAQMEAHLAEWRARWPDQRLRPASFEAAVAQVASLAAQRNLLEEARAAVERLASHPPPAELAAELAALAAPLDGISQVLAAAAAAGGGGTGEPLAWHAAAWRDVFAAVQEPAACAGALCRLADVLLHTGRPAQAQAVAALGLAKLRQAGDGAEEGGVRYLLMALALPQGAAVPVLLGRRQAPLAEGRQAPPPWDLQAQRQSAAAPLPEACVQQGASAPLPGGLAQQTAPRPQGQVRPHDAAGGVTTLKVAAGKSCGGDTVVTPLGNAEPQDQSHVQAGVDADDVDDAREAAAEGGDAGARRAASNGDDDDARGAASMGDDGDDRDGGNDGDNNDGDDGDGNAASMGDVDGARGARSGVTKRDSEVARTHASMGHDGDNSGGGAVPMEDDGEGGCAAASGGDGKAGCEVDLDVGGPSGDTVTCRRRQDADAARSAAGRAAAAVAATATAAIAATGAAATNAAAAGAAGERSGSLDAVGGTDDAGGGGGHGGVGSEVIEIDLDTDDDKSQAEEEEEEEPAESKRLASQRGVKQAAVVHDVSWQGDDDELDVGGSCSGGGGDADGSVSASGGGGGGGGVAIGNEVLDDAQRNRANGSASEADLAEDEDEEDEEEEMEDEALEEEENDEEEEEEDLQEEEEEELEDDDDDDDDDVMADVIADGVEEDAMQAVYGGDRSGSERGYGSGGRSHLKYCSSGSGGSGHHGRRSGGKRHHGRRNGGGNSHHGRRSNSVWNHGRRCARRTFGVGGVGSGGGPFELNAMPAGEGDQCSSGSDDGMRSGGGRGGDGGGDVRRAVLEDVMQVGEGGHRGGGGGGTRSSSGSDELLRRAAPKSGLDDEEDEEVVIIRRRSGAMADRQEHAFDEAGRPAQPAAAPVESPEPKAATRSFAPFRMWKW